MITLRDFSQLSLINKVLSIEHFSIILWFFEPRDVVRNIVRDFYFSRWACFFCLNLIVVTLL